jgi:hypothetical protein
MFNGNIGGGTLTGNDNTAVGDSALLNLAGAAVGNTALGSSALLFNSAGTYIQHHRHR